jgi:hypothetical protein
MLHRPLYSISIGELGTSAKALEIELKEIFDMTHDWNVIILIDEGKRLIGVLIDWYCILTIYCNYIKLIFFLNAEMHMKLNVML